MIDDGKLKEYSLKTFTTKSHPRVDINEDESVREHYVTTIMDQSFDRSSGYPTRNDLNPYSKKDKIDDSEILNAIMNHINLVNDLKEDGEWQVNHRLRDRN